MIALSLILLSGCIENNGSTSSDSTPINSGDATLKTEPYFRYSWHLDSVDSKLNQNGFSIDRDSDINMDEAWSITKGAGVKVAVIDDSYDVVHEDLKSNIFITYNISSKGVDVTNKTNNPSHGNACAGFIASPINNRGSVGTAPESKLILINDIYEEDDAGSIEAFEYAKSQGAKVISCSWGTGAISQTVVAELKSLYDANITVLFASGNEDSDLDIDSSNYDESEVEWVIGVGASGENNDVTSYSNYGVNIDILAPGGDTELSSGLLGLDDTGTKGEYNQHGLVTNNYSFTNGTSFSCPVAAGVVALMYSANPSITSKQVRDILISTAEKVGSDVTSYDSKGFDRSRKRAYGKIDAGRAVKAAKDLL